MVQPDPALGSPEKHTHSWQKRIIRPNLCSRYLFLYYVPSSPIKACSPNTPKLSLLALSLSSFIVRILVSLPAIHPPPHHSYPIPESIPNLPKAQRGSGHSPQNPAEGPLVYLTHIHTSGLNVPSALPFRCRTTPTGKSVNAG